MRIDDTTQEHEKNIWSDLGKIWTNRENFNYPWTTTLATNLLVGQHQSRNRTCAWWEAPVRSKATQDSRIINKLFNEPLLFGVPYYYDKVVQIGLVSETSIMSSHPIPKFIQSTLIPKVSRATPKRGGHFNANTATVGGATTSLAIPWFRSACHPLITTLLKTVLHV